MFSYNSLYNIIINYDNNNYYIRYFCNTDKESPALWKQYITIEKKKQSYQIPIFEINYKDYNDNIKYSNDLHMIIV